MAADTIAEQADLDDFAPLDLTFEGSTKRVWKSGTGPAVVVMTEMPGISPHVLRFARWVRDAGFTVWLPSLFGQDGAIPGAEEGAAVFRRACVSAEFRALGGGASSPVIFAGRSTATGTTLMAAGYSDEPAVTVPSDETTKTRSTTRWSSR